MIIVVAALSSLVYDSVQANRIAYIAVRADKEIYTSAENVTFKLIPLTEGVQFTVEAYDWLDRNWNGVHVVKIPSDVDPAEVTTNISLLNQLSSWDRGNAIVPVRSFNSTGEPLELSWNGTILVGNEMLNGTKWVKATSGHYLLYPRLQWSYGHVTKFMLDDNAVFYYDSLNTNISTVRTDNSFSMSMDISLGKGMPEGEYELASLLYPMAYSEDPSLIYINRTFALTADGSFHLDFGPIKANEYSQATYDAVVKGPDGKLYAFGFSKSDYGGWYNSYEY